MWHVSKVRKTVTEFILYLKLHGAETKILAKLYRTVINYSVCYSNLLLLEMIQCLQILYYIFTNVTLCTIWYHLYNLKNVQNTHGGVLLLAVKLEASAYNFTKSNTRTWVFFAFFKLYK